MYCSIQPAIYRGRRYAFPVVWAAVFATGVGLSEPLPAFDAAPFLSFAPIGKAQASSPDETMLVALDAEPQALTFLPPPANDPDDVHRSTIDPSMGHGRFAAPGNALRRQVQLRAVSPRTADELAGFFRNVSFTLLTDIRQGEAVPPIKVDRVPADLGNKDGHERKQLFITAILPVVLEVNHRVMSDREQLLALRDKLAIDPYATSPIDRIWLEDLADRYETTPDRIDELVRRVDIVPPSMAIAQGGVESGWGTSFAAAPATRCTARSRRSAGTASMCHGSRATACRSRSPASARRRKRTSPISTPIPPMPASAAPAPPRASAARSSRAIA